MEIKRFFHSIFRMFWLVILLSFLGGSIAAYLTVGSYEPMYQAETTIYAVAKSSPGVSGIDYQDILVSRQLVQDYEKIVMSDKVMSRAEENLKEYGITKKEIRNMTTVNWQKDSSIIGVTAVSNDAGVAARVSKVVSNAFIDNLYDITHCGIIGVLDDAHISGISLPGNNIKLIAIGIFAGLFVALAIIYIKELFDTTVRSAEDVEYKLKLNVIGIIPKYVIK